MKIKKIKLPFSAKEPVLALGPQAKNTICFVNGGTARFSSMYNDLSDPDGLADFEKDAQYFLRKKPSIIAYDLHPEYQSTRFALALAGDYRKIAVQHHHAHIVSCMLDNRLKDRKVIGVAFDGTGMGSDKNLWGAEFLISGYSGFKRVAHLMEIPLLGGEKAIKEPWRLTAAWLYLMHKDKFLDLRADFCRKINRADWHILKEMYLSGFNCPLASSMGRLFDAVSVLILGRMKVDFEAELAIQLEKMSVAPKRRAPRYSFDIKKENGVYILNPAPVFEGIITDLKRRVNRREIACDFHCAVARAVRKTCLLLKKQLGIVEVVLSGGVFQNNLLLSLVKDLLYREGFKVFSHSAARPDDSGISLGQAAVACFSECHIPA